MSGKAKAIIDTIMEQRAHGNTTLIATTRTKLMLKGINVDLYSASSNDDPAIVEKLVSIAKDMNIQLGGK